MKKGQIILLVLLAVSCSRDKLTTYFTPEKAVYYFNKVETICNDDGGKLWGKNLYGPIMYVDRISRKLYANQQDKEGILKLKDGVYTGDYPGERIINMGDIEFGGTLFAMVPLPRFEDDYRIKTMTIRSLFHYYQRTSGLETMPFNTRHMDEKPARLLLKLEWRALRNAVESTGDKRIQAIRDALIFRGARREQYPGRTADENRFENHEGLPTFTFTLLCNKSDKEVKEKLIQNLDSIYRFPSYSRSFGIISGALYAYLGYSNGYDLKEIKCDTVNLASIVEESYNIHLPEFCRDVAGSLALGYDVESIYREEEERQAFIKEFNRRQLSTFTERPVVYLELESPYFDFEPGDIRPLDTLGTIYDAIRISDNWGKLTVEKGGCLVSSNIRFSRITAKNFKETKNHYSGDGWHLILNSDWQVVKIDDNYFVRKLIP